VWHLVLAMTFVETVTHGCNDKRGPFKMNTWERVDLTELSDIDESTVAAPVLGAMCPGAACGAGCGGLGCGAGCVGFTAGGGCAGAGCGAWCGGLGCGFLC